MKSNIKFKIRSSVDLYLHNNETLIIYYMNTRYKKQFKISNLIIKFLELIDGKRTLDEIHTQLENILNNTVDFKKLLDLVAKLYELNILEDVIEITEEEELEIYKRYDRQINYFGDFLGGDVKSIEAQKKLKNSKILVFGCGAIGGDIVIQLAMAGVENFILYDYDIVSESDVTRHLYFKPKYLGKKKIDALEDYLKGINSNIKVEKYDSMLTPSSKIDSIIDSSSFVVNTADEPYIGYTALKISRYCTEKGKPHIIGGGFAAHLASTGELIIPGVTPCVDCYTNYITEKLVNWKPKKRYLKNGDYEVGGLSSLSLFSSSYSVIEIIKIISGLTNMAEYSNTRGEFLFTNMSLGYYEVERNKNCKVCGGIITNDK